MKKVKILLALFALTGAILFSSETKSQAIQRVLPVYPTIEITKGKLLVISGLGVADCTESGDIICIYKKE